MKVLAAQAYLTLSDSMYCSPPGFSVHGTSQIRILEWVAISSARGSFDPEIEPGSPALQADALLSEPPGKHHPDCWESDNANCALWALWWAGFLMDSAKRATSTRDVRVVREKILGISFAKKLINRNFN